MDKSKIDFLMKTLARIDQNMMMANLKASFIMSADIIMIIMLMSNYEAYIKMYHLNQIMVKTVFFIMMGASVISLIMSLKIIIAFLASGSVPEMYRSLIYFGSIKDMSLAEYRDQINKADENVIIEDHIRQIHLLSSALHKKYLYINLSIYFFIAIPATCFFLFFIRLFS